MCYYLILYLRHDKLSVFNTMITTLRVIEVFLNLLKLVMQIATVKVVNLWGNMDHLEWHIIFIFRVYLQNII